MTIHNPEHGERYHRVELSPQPQIIHLASHCGPDGDLIMVNFYQNSRWLTFAEALELASALIRCAWDQDSDTLKVVMKSPDAKAWLSLSNGGKDETS